MTKIKTFKELQTLLNATCLRSSENCYYDKDFKKIELKQDGEAVKIDGWYIRCVDIFTDLSAVYQRDNYNNFFCICRIGGPDEYNEKKM